MKEYIIQQKKTRTLMTYKSERDLPNGTQIAFFNTCPSGIWNVIEQL